MAVSAPAAALSGQDPGNWADAQLGSARTAQQEWARAGIAHRIAVLRRFRHLLAAEAQSLTSLLSPGLARTPADTLSAEILPLAEAVRFVELNSPSLLRSRRLSKRGRPVWLGGVQLVLEFQPWGVVLVIGPANYPIFLPGVQTVQALAAGNAVVWKPGRDGSEVALGIARLLRKAGVPDHLLQITDESADTAQRLIESGVDKIVMTGSVSSGKAVLRAAAEQLTPATVELSGCDAMFVMAGADVSRAVAALLFGLRLNGGATCIAPRRVFVDARMEQSFKAELLCRLADVPSTAVATATLSLVKSLVDDALSQGAQLLNPDLRLANPLSPVILENASPEMAVMRTDVFAPIAGLARYEDEEQALDLARHCQYALGATVFGRAAEASAFASRVSAGIVVVNDMIVPTADPRLSFGGRDASGFGKSRGSEGLLEMVTSKTVAIQTSRRLRHLEQPHPRAQDLFTGFLKCIHGRGAAFRWQSARELTRALTGKTEGQDS